MIKNKDFKKWNIEKENKHNLADHKWCKEGYVWWCALGENIGFEEDGKGYTFSRPVLVLKVFSKMTAIVIPLTSSEKENKYHIELGDINKIKSFAIFSQVRIIDTKRLIKKEIKLEKEIFEKIKKSVRDLF